MSFNTPDQLLKPWSWNILLEGFVWLIVLLLFAAVILWTRAGRDRKNLPDQVGRNVEDFAGITQESNGSVPIFLFIVFLIVGLSMLSYPIITLILNYNY
ncbi:MAG: hypothetical protein ABIQ44_09165 [Chloroflexia bacterium]